MDIYLFDFDTKEYTGKESARQCELKPTDYILPCNATTIKPAKPKKGFVTVFNREAKEWSALKDNRGTWFDKVTGQQVEVTGLYADISNLTKLAQPDNFHTFDETKGKWVKDNSKVCADLHNQALELLSKSDYMVIWDKFQEYEKEKQEQILAYRKELRRVINRLKDGFMAELPTLE